MMNCFCGMVDRRNAFSLISNRDHCQRSSPSRISSAQNLSSGLVEWRCAILTTTTPLFLGATFLRARTKRYNIRGKSVETAILSAKVTEEHIPKNRLFSPIANAPFQTIKDKVLKNGPKVVFHKLYLVHS